MVFRSLFFLVLFFVLPLLGFSPVEDRAGLLSNSWKEKRASFLIQYREKTRVQIQILIVHEIPQNLSLESYSLKEAEKRGLGDKKTDKGLLILISKGDKGARLEVGQGLEGDIPDVIAKRILEDQMFPLFRSGQFEKGLDLGLVSLSQLASPEQKPWLESFWQGEWKDFNGKSFADSELQKNNQDTKKGLSFFVLIFVIILLLLLLGGRADLVLLILFHLSRAGGAGGRGGGGWSGGGGGFSGGGASGRW